jgi:hypothetical protein
MSRHPALLARTEGIIVESLDGELLVYDLERDKAHALNEVAAWVWERCDGQRTSVEIARQLPASFGGGEDPAEAEEIILHALRQLSAQHLLVGDPEIPEGVTRRHLMRKLAVAGAVGVALPVVRSIVAPTAAQAATCLAPNQPCLSSVQCCSGICNGGFCL